MTVSTLRLILPVRRRMSCFDSHPPTWGVVKWDNNARPHGLRAVAAFRRSEAMTSVPWPVMIPDFNPIEHIWDIYTGSETSCAKHSSVGRALHREWQQLSQKDILRLTGGMRRRVEAVIQERGGCTRYWTLNNRCHQVIHSWRLESEMTILSCFFICEGQYLKWTCFIAKTGLVILWLNIH